MPFEFDPEKDLANQQKHGISFKEAEALWNDPLRLIVPANTQGEARFSIIASWRSKVWTGIFTPRDGATRIISVRRARAEEKELYENAGF